MIQGDRLSQKRVTSTDANRGRKQTKERHRASDQDGKGAPAVGLGESVDAAFDRGCLQAAGCLGLGWLL